MDRWDKSQRDHRHLGNYKENPSFSSTLLDAIYRSIDEGGDTKERENKLVLYRETMKQKQNNFFDRDHEDKAIKASSFHQSRKLEKWMDSRVCEKIEYRRNSIHSSSSSTDSSSNGGFSSSESSSEFFNNGVQKLKPIKTSVVPSQKSNFDSLNSQRNNLVHTQKPKQENGLEKKTSKSKALRRILYGDLKKSKQPISPGAKLASFLNSLFNSGGGNNKNNAKKKPKVMVSSNTTITQPSTTCSSASSFSRSCLSKTPSSIRSAAKANRSVRFCPVSVIVDEDCRPCGHKNVYEEEKGFEKFNYVKSSYNSEELRFHVMQESRRMEKYARDLLRNYEKKKKEEGVKKFDEIMMHYEDDDAASCSSSDLFELENLSGIGNIERFREELPVYETTHYNTNRAIANNNGFML